MGLGGKIVRVAGNVIDGTVDFFSDDSQGSGGDEVRVESYKRLVLPLSKLKEMCRINGKVTFVSYDNKRQQLQIKYVESE